MMKLKSSLMKKYLKELIIENDKCIVLENIGKHDGECKKGFKLNKLTLGFVI